LNYREGLKGLSRTYFGQANLKLGNQKGFFAPLQTPDKRTILPGLKLTILGTFIMSYLGL
jgi:hypothetical protein